MSRAARELVLLADWLRDRPGFPGNKAVLRLLATRIIAGVSNIDVDAVFEECGVAV